LRSPSKPSGLTLPSARLDSPSTTSHTFDDTLELEVVESPHNSFSLTGMPSESAGGSGVFMNEMPIVRQGEITQRGSIEWDTALPLRQVEPMYYSGKMRRMPSTDFAAAPYEPTSLWAAPRLNIGKTSVATPAPSTSSTPQLRYSFDGLDKVPVPFFFEGNGSSGNSLALQDQFRSS